jgi:hypothetical protein
MEYPLIHANIFFQQNKPYYQVKLHAVPRIGEHIELTSLKDIETGHSRGPISSEVIKVIHKLHDLTDKFPNGVHEVEIYVK